ncbi:hypothetical protein [Acinetobacter portensis]|uniref:hypothetical protein n=1 Tax=Acinetobacter portensis TaxID=1839785 RepID=UPI0013D569D2|nr:hypothetical protein [Acinetobacter portensis]
MGNNICVAIVGLSLNTTNQLKSLFLNAVNDGLKITWSNISNSELDFVILNQNFIDSPAAINIKDKNILIITIHHDKNKDNTIENNQLYLPFSNLNMLKEWISQHIKYEEKTNTINRENINLIDTFNTIFHSNHSNFFLCHINNEQNFVIDRKMHEIWISDHFEFNHIESLAIEALDFNQAVNFRSQTKKYDLSLWLWNYLWLNLKHAPNSSKSTCYKLKYWPQPNKNIPKETLKIASCLQYGAEIDTITNHLEIDPKLIHKFIYIGLACNLLEKIHPNEVKFKLNSEENTSSTLRNFFSKMRKKLGI